MIRYNVNISVVAIAHAEYNTTTTKRDSRALILGSFYWCCWMTELFSGLILDKFGCRGILSVCILINVVSSFMFPVAYDFHPICAAVVRAIQGLSLGIVWPAIAWLIAKWIPKTERNKFMTSYHGLSLGTSVTNLTGGLIIDRFGWPFVFYGTGAMCILWAVVWWPNVYDTPQKHPMISKEELEYIEQNIVPSDSVKTVSHSIPWLQIAKSKPFWALNIIFFTMHWFNVTLATQTPSYFDTVHLLNIKTNGYLTSLPDLMKIVSGTLSPLAIDYILDKKQVSLTASRKISGVLSMLGPAVFLAFLAVYGNESVSVAAILIILSVAASGCGSSAIMANIIDISPNHAGTLMGIMKTCTLLSGILSPVATQQLLNNDKNNWYLVFTVSIVMMTFSTIFFVIFGSADVQPWNYPRKTVENIEENKNLMKLKVQVLELNQNDDKVR
ncbi:Major Facilitator Superfamily Transporter 17 [Carabus blaptoides fortunei]